MKIKVDKLGFEESLVCGSKSKKIQYNIALRILLRGCTQKT